MLEFTLGHRMYLMSEEQIHKQWARFYQNINCYNVEEVQREVQILFIYQTSSDFSVQKYSDLSPSIYDMCNCIGLFCVFS